MSFASYFKDIDLSSKFKKVYDRKIVTIRHEATNVIKAHEALIKSWYLMYWIAFMS